MKNIKFIYIALFLILGSFTACKKYLDIQPKGIIIPRTTQDYANILNNDNLIRGISTDLDIMSDWYYDPYLQPAQQSQTPADRVYSWQKNIYDPQSVAQEYWTKLYNRIYQANVVLNNIDQTTQGSAAEKQAIKAKAMFIRADSYFYLLNLYAKPYNAATASTDLGVPIATTSDIKSIPTKRNTIQEGYNLMISDLENALNYLPNQGATVYEMNKIAAYELLSKIYLFTNNPTKCESNAAKALAMNSYLLDYNTIYDVTGDDVNPYYLTSETYFSADPPVLLNANKENIFTGMFDSEFGLLSTFIGADKFALFEDGDLRKMFYTADNSDGEWSYNYFLYAPSNINCSTPELYLMHAEAQAKLGNTAAALNDLNKLRKNRITTDSFTNLTSNDAKTILKWIYAEREREFYNKGKRWFDMRRLNNDPDFGFVARHYYSDGTYVELPKNSPRYTLQIPISAVTGDMVQNP